MSLTVQDTKQDRQLTDMDLLEFERGVGFEAPDFIIAAAQKDNADDIRLTDSQQVIHDALVDFALYPGDRWYIAIVVLGKGFYTFEVERNEEEIEALIQQEHKFWNYVKTDQEPPVDGTDSTSEALNQVFHPSDDVGSVIISDELTSLLLEIKAKQKELQVMQKEYENQIKDIMGDAVYAYSNHANITWKESVSKRFDTTRFKKENPDMYQKYVKESKTRRFLIKEIEEEEE